MEKTEKLQVLFRGRPVGRLSLTTDNRLNVFEYDKSWIVEGFSISPIEFPLKPGIFIAKPQPFHGNFGIFEDSLPDGYGRYLLHKALLRKGIDDSGLTSLDRLAIVGDNGMGGMTVIKQLLMIGGGIITGLPMVFYSIGVRNLPLMTTGICQYISPTLGIVCGAIMGEALTREKLVSFLFIWVGVILYVLNTVYEERRKKSAVQ